MAAVGLPAYIQYSGERRMNERRTGFLAGLFAARGADRRVLSSTSDLQELINDYVYNGQDVPHGIPAQLPAGLQRLVHFIAHAPTEEAYAERFMSAESRLYELGDCLESDFCDEGVTVGTLERCRVAYAVVAGERKVDALFSHA